MKSAFIFLTTLLAVSHQQYQLPRMFTYIPKLSVFVQQPAYYNDYLQDSNYFDYYSEGRQANRFDRFDNPAVFRSQINALKKEEDINVQPRIKGYGSQVQSDPNQQNARFFFNTVTEPAAVNVGILNQGALNPLLKTVTFTLTSTCTSYSLVTCVPAAYVINTPCRRKRQIGAIELIGDNTNSQFPIVPSKIQQLEPTMQQPWSTVVRDSRQSLFDIVSSKTEHSTTEERNEEHQVENLPRQGRFYNFWQSFAIGTTITTWAIINSTTTITSIPTSANPAVAVNEKPSILNCLPSAISIC